MASPLVCVLKGNYGKDGVRLAVDYHYVDKCTVGDTYPIPDIPDIVQRMGSAEYISCFDVQLLADQGETRSPWLTAFICDQGVFEWKRTSLGMKSSGSTFVREI